MNKKINITLVDILSLSFILCLRDADVCLNYCDNGGECVKDVRGEPSCRCVGSFTGRHCREKSEFAYIASGVAGGVIFIIFLVLLVWMICAR